VTFLMRVETVEQYQLAERQGRDYGHTHVPGVALKAPHAIAYVNHGRWLADCPFNCGGARMVQPNVDFWCVFCGNAEAGGQGVPVDWPSDAVQVDDVLRYRALERYRNWIPGETIAVLRKENQDNGQRVP
jgi:hypothetical protein